MTHRPTAVIYREWPFWVAKVSTGGFCTFYRRKNAEKYVVEKLQEAMGYKPPNPSAVQYSVSEDGTVRYKDGDIYREVIL